MDFILSQLSFVRWAFSPFGLVTVLAMGGLLVSGMPGAILPKVEVWASLQRSNATPQRLAPDATSDDHRERMAA